ncbi:MAG: AAA family ATPase [Lentimicrobium sp.]|nr:AAA family ATPase [Lentimicrobium sp.]
MESSIIKKIILENQARIPDLEVSRRAYEFDSAVNYIFTGQRRAGKTWYMFAIIQQMLQQGRTAEEILYINFEDERLIGMDISQMDGILDSYRELYSHQPLLFFDELQNIEGWQKFARRLADSGYRVYITGSNSTMLSSEMASTLGGRFMVLEIETLTFDEFLTFNGHELSPNFEFSAERFDVFRLFESYFTHGGFPELVGLRDKKEYLSTIFQYSWAISSPAIKSVTRSH